MGPETPPGCPACHGRVVQLQPLVHEQGAMKNTFHLCRGAVLPTAQSPLEEYLRLMTTSLSLQLASYDFSSRKVTTES